uniref:Secreted protein n=1 Tax=Panagrellus redivivus TaxID=6233 RepID=A0A7E4W0Z9_PANRE
MLTIERGISRLEFPTEGKTIPLKALFYLLAICGFHSIKIRVDQVNSMPLLFHCITFRVDELSVTLNAFRIIHDDACYAIIEPLFCGIVSNVLQ